MLHLCIAVNRRRFGGRSKRKETTRDTETKLVDEQAARVRPFLHIENSNAEGTFEERSSCCTRDNLVCSFLL